MSSLSSAAIDSRNSIGHSVGHNRLYTASWIKALSTTTSAGDSVVSSEARKARGASLLLLHLHDCFAN
ncbi:hypothetical protein ACB094_04G027800 [Castanea mollissima]